MTDGQDGQAATAGTSEILSEWGCPAAYIREYDPIALWEQASIAEVSAAANWYWEMDAALRAMVVARDGVAIREWAASDVWERIARDTGEEEGVEEYCRDVRDALTSLADSLEAGEVSA